MLSKNKRKGGGPLFTLLPYLLGSQLATATVLLPAANNNSKKKKMLKIIRIHQLIIQVIQKKKEFIGKIITIYLYQR